MENTVYYSYNKINNAVSYLELNKLDLSLINNFREFIATKIANLAYYNFIYYKQRG